MHKLSESLLGHMNGFLGVDDVHALATSSSSLVRRQAFYLAKISEPNRLRLIQNQRNYRHPDYIPENRRDYQCQCRFRVERQDAQLDAVDAETEVVVRPIQRERLQSLHRAAAVMTTQQGIDLVKLHRWTHCKSELGGDFDFIGSASADFPDCPRFWHIKHPSWCRTEKLKNQYRRDLLHRWRRSVSLEKKDALKLVNKLTSTRREKHAKRTYYDLFDLRVNALIEATMGLTTKKQKRKRADGAVGAGVGAGVVAAMGRRPTKWHAGEWHTVVVLD